MELNLVYRDTLHERRQTLLMLAKRTCLMLCAQPTAESVSFHFVSVGYHSVHWSVTHKGRVTQDTVSDTDVASDIRILLASHSPHPHLNSHPYVYPNRTFGGLNQSLPTRWPPTSPLSQR